MQTLYLFSWFSKLGQGHFLNSGLAYSSLQILKKTLIVPIEIITLWLLSSKDNSKIIRSKNHQIGFCHYINSAYQRQLKVKNALYACNVLDNAPNLEITAHFSGLYSQLQKISRAVTGLIEYTLSYKTGEVFYFSLLALRWMC